jgi:hypothetical protein
MPDETDEKFFMGIELEVDGTSNQAVNLNGAINDVREKYSENDVILKSDGSLNRGFEVVTQPMTMRYHIEKFDWNHITNACRDHGFRSHNTRTCGLHIHVDRTSMTLQQMVRLGYFVNAEHKRFSKIARREGVSYSRYKDLSQGVTMTADSIARNDDRYEALNWQNSETVEFRMYRGTLKVSTILATIELTHAVCKFITKVSTGSLLNRKLRWKRFMNFMKKNGYNRAVAYAESKIDN